MRLPSRLARAAVLACLFAAPRAAFAAPKGTCAEAAPIGFPSVSIDSTATQDQPAAASSCGREDRFALWYTFTAPEAGRYVFSTAGSTGLTDTTVDVYASCGGASPSIACNDDTLDSLLAAVQLDMTAGQQVFVRVAGWGNTRGDFQLGVYRPEWLDQPANDECSQAIPLSFPSRTPATTLHSTGTDVSSCGSDDASDLWYSFTAPETRDYEFFLTENSTSANLLALYTGCGTGEIDCGLAHASAHLDAGQLVYLRVGTSPNASDTFNVNVGPFPPAVVPANDAYTTATPITSVPQTLTGTTVGATADGIGFGPSCGPFVHNAVWYSFTAPSDGTYVFDTNGSAMENTVVAVFDACLSGNGNPPELFTCDDDAGIGKRSRIDGFLNAGQSVCVAVAGNYLSEDGAFTLNVSKQPDAPANDRCEGAKTLPFPGKIEAENYAARPELPAGTCPFGDFALWYTFTAPADGVYKFDVKDSVETSPDIALYDACGGEPVVCSTDPKPAVSRAMTKGQTSLVRVSTDVWWRSPMVLRVGPEGMPNGSGGGGAGGAGGAGAGGGSTTSGGGGAMGGSGGAAAGGGGTGGQDSADGCGCRAAGSGGEDGALAGVALVMAVLARRRRQFV